MKNKKFYFLINPEDVTGSFEFMGTELDWTLQICNHKNNIICDYLELKTLETGVDWTDALYDINDECENDGERFMDEDGNITNAKRAQEIINSLNEEYFDNILEYLSETCDAENVTIKGKEYIKVDFAKFLNEHTVGKIGSIWKNDEGEFDNDAEDLKWFIENISSSYSYINDDDKTYMYGYLDACMN